MKRIILLCLFIGSGILLMAQSRQDLEEQKNSTLREIQQARELLEQTESQRKNTVQRVAVLNRGIRARQRLIDAMGRELELLDREISDLEMQIDSLDRTIKKGKEEYARIIYSVYRNHTEEDKLMYILASESINQFYQRIKYLNYLSDYRERKVEELELLMVEMEAKGQELLSARDEKAILLTEQENESRLLIRERMQKNSIADRLAQDERKLRKQIEEKNRIRLELESEIRKIIEEEARMSSGGASMLTPEERLVGNNFNQNKGRLPWPVDRGVVTTQFGLVDHPVLSGVKIPSNGIDISSIKGIRARAVFDGEVTSVIAILGANYAVIVRHGEYMTVYLNLVDLKVKVGDKVLMKQELGTVFTDEDQDLTELTFQIYKERDLQDPEDWLSK